MTDVSATASLTMTDLYQRLADLGLSKRYLRTYILPDWWTDEVDEEPGVGVQAAFYLSRRLNLDIKPLLNGGKPAFVRKAQAKFRASDNTDFQKMAIPYAVALRVAEMIADVCPQPYTDLSALSIADIRQEILRQNATVNLSSLIDFCWFKGIPVCHLNQFPNKVHRFQGMVVHFQSRPVVVVSLNDCSPARLLFIVAHELGHILAGHLDKEDCKVDSKIQLESDDDEENEANQVAAELLLGQFGISYDIWTQKYLSSEELVAYSRKVASVNRADPGVIAMNVAWNRAKRARGKKAERIAWATSKKALATMEPGANAPVEVNHRLIERLNLLAPSETLSEDDSKAYLRTMLGLRSE